MTNSTKKYNIGVDLGATKVLCAIVEKNTNKIITEVKKKTKKEKGNKKIITKLFDALDELFLTAENEFDIKKSDINIISIATAGQVDRKKGILINSCNLNCQNLNLKEITEEKYNLKTFILNDVEASAIGELLAGAGKDNQNILCVFIGTGIGSAIIINRKIYHGSSGFAGEFGHTLIDKNGRACSCGAFGCLEAYASRSAIEGCIEGMIKKGKKSIIQDLSQNQNITTKHIKQALCAHDEVAVICVDEAIEYLSSSLASAVNFLNPDLIILGGGLIEGIDEIYLKTIKQTKAKALSIPLEILEFKKAQLGDYSGVIGAALIEEYNNSGNFGENCHE